jgi:hypothetical protein
VDRERRADNHVDLLSLHCVVPSVVRLG